MSVSISRTKEYLGTGETRATFHCDGTMPCLKELLIRAQIGKAKISARHWNILLLRMLSRGLDLLKTP